MLLLFHPDAHNQLVRHQLYAEYLQTDPQTVNRNVFVLFVHIPHGRCNHVLCLVHHVEIGNGIGTVGLGTVEKLGECFVFQFN